jgi:hypothetical protein
MPIIYVHGVNTRDADHFDPVKKYLRRIVAPRISKTPDAVEIIAADWFQLCRPPKFGGIARPRTILLGQGAGAEITRDPPIEELLAQVAERDAQAQGGLTAGQATKVTARLDKLKDHDLADLLTLALSTGASPLRQAEIGVAADAVVRNPMVWNALTSAPSLDAQLKVLADAMDKEVAKTENLAAAGALDFLTGLKDRVSEGLSRVVDMRGGLATVALSELRPMLNDFVTRFLGDVLYYMSLRGTQEAPGPIPMTLIDVLRAADASKARRNGEPIVLLTHSMGGQIAYDAITSFLPAIGKDITVDFWCATASQVGFFEELNMFLASSKDHSSQTKKLVPFPQAHLGHWWNIWDKNDIISFTTKDIFDPRVDDEDFWSGMSIAAAHGGYLARPSFYRAFADKLGKAFPERGA